MDAFRTAIKINPKSIEAHLGLSAAYWNAGLWDEAAKSIDDALRIDRTNWKVWEMRFFISLNMLSFEDAKFSLEVIKDLNDLPQETYEKMLNEFEKRKKIDQSWSK